MDYKQAFDSLTDGEFTVLYWKCQGLTYEQIEVQLDFKYSLSWIQKQSTSGDKKLGLGDMLSARRKEVIQNEVCPALHEWIEGRTKEVKNPPPTETVEGEPVEEEKPDKRLIFVPPLPPSPKPPPPPPVNRRVVVLAILTLVVCGLCIVGLGGGFLVYRNVRTAIVSQMQTSGPMLTENAGKIRGLETMAAEAQTQTQQAIVPIVPNAPIVPTDIPRLGTSVPPPISTPKEYYGDREAVYLRDGVSMYTTNGFSLNGTYCTPPSPGFAVEIVVVNASDTQFLLRYDTSAFHAVDNLGNKYELTRSGINRCFDDIGAVQFLITPNYQASIFLRFSGQAPLDATYYLITADWISGIGPIVFRKDL